MNSRILLALVGSASLSILTAFGGESVVRVTDINPGPVGSYPSWITVFGNELVFRANDSLNNVELWRFDGTNASRVSEINPGTNGSSPSELSVLNGALYFNAEITNGPRRLWKYDGTNAAPVLNLNPPYQFYSGGSWKPVVFQGSLWYLADARMNIFDGKQFSYLNRPPWPQMQVVLWQNALHYGAGTTDIELWKFDGAAQSLVTNINPIESSYPDRFCAFRNKLFFAARDDTHGFELFSFDGATTRLEADIWPGNSWGTPNSSQPSELTVFNNQLYFCADDGVRGFELWCFDGTNASLAADINTNAAYEVGGDHLSDSYPRKLTVWRNNLYLIASPSIWWHSGIWKFDGTNASLVGGVSDDQISELIVFKDRLYFDCDDGRNGRELWRIEPEAAPRASIAMPGNRVKLELSSAETGRYAVEASSDLTSWTAISTNITTNGAALFINLDRTDHPSRAYRIIKLP